MFQGKKIGVEGRGSEMEWKYSKTCLQGTLRREDNLWSGDTFSKQCPIFPMLRNLWWRDTCHVGTLSLGYRGVPWRQVLLYMHSQIRTFFMGPYIKSRAPKSIISDPGIPSSGLALSRLCRYNDIIWWLIHMMVIVLHNLLL